MMRYFLFPLLMTISSVGPLELLAANKETSKEVPAFNFWKGDWEGELTIYSPTGDKLDTIRVHRVCTSSDAHGQDLLNMDITSEFATGPSEHHQGVYLTDSRGFRRILRTDKGQPVSDLRGRSVGVGKLYWYTVDNNAVLRESYLETIEGDTARVHGFYWDGKRSGSYRIVEALYTRKKQG